MTQPMLLGSYTITLVKEQGSRFTTLYNESLLWILEDSKYTHSAALLAMATEIDPTAATFSLQVTFASETDYMAFSEKHFPEIIKVLNIEFPQQYAYFHTLLRYI